MGTSNSRHWCVAVLVAIAFSVLVTSEGSAQLRKRRYSTWTPTNKPAADELVGAGDSKNAGDSKKKKKADADTDATSLNSGKRVRNGNDVGLGTPVTGAGSIPLTNGQTFTLGGGLPGSPGGRATASATGPVQFTAPGAPISGMSMPPSGMSGGGAGGHGGGMPGAPPGGGSPGPPGGLPGAPPGGGGGGHGGR